MILWPRLEDRIRPPVFVVVYLPSAVLILKWSQFREAWAELGLAGLIAVAIFLVWWVPYGRKLPPPKGSQIKVITDDDEE
jgi:membrane protease YdiL (CAAX protease family)